MQGISCNLLMCCHSVVTTTNPIVAGVTLYDWFKDLALLLEVKQHKGWLPVRHVNAFLFVLFTFIMTVIAALNSSVINGQYVMYRQRDAKARYLALLFQPCHLGVEFFFYRAEDIINVKPCRLLAELQGLRNSKVYLCTNRLLPVFHQFSQGSCWKE